MKPYFNREFIMYFLKYAGATAAIIICIVAVLMGVIWFIVAAPLWLLIPTISVLLVIWAGYTIAVDKMNEKYGMEWR